MNDDRKIAEMYEHAKEQKVSKVDYISPVSLLAFDDEARIVITNDAQALIPNTKVPPMPQTEHAFTQICQKLGGAVFTKEDNKRLPVDYLLAINPKLRATNLNDAISHMPHNSGWTVRSDTGEVRAVMDKYYFPFDNLEMIDILHEVLKEDGTPHRISNQSYVKPDEMRVDVLIGRKQTGPDGGGNKEWMWGAGIRNDEIGRGSGGVLAILKRSSCDNTIAVDASGYNYTFRHWAKKEDLRALKKTEFKLGIAQILPTAEELINKMIEADYHELPKLGELVKGMTIDQGWSDDFVGKMWQGTEGHNTLAGLVNGVTYAAQSLEDPSARFEAELLGGAILIQPDSVFYPAMRALENQERREEREARREAKKQARTHQR